MSEGQTEVGDVCRVDWGGLGVTMCHGCDSTHGYISLVPLARACTHILGSGSTAGMGPGQPSGTHGCTPADLYMLGWSKFKPKLRGSTSDSESELRRLSLESVEAASLLRLSTWPCDSPVDREDVEVDDREQVRAWNRDADGVGLLLWAKLGKPGHIIIIILGMELLESWAMDSW